ncbi:MAG: YdiU family protein [Saprospiraceae bacterium]|nr:YdiU family protein [Saprospiraceae bacterium]
MPKIILHNTFTDKLQADPDTTNTRRQVYHACYSWVSPKGMKDPSMIIYSKDLAFDLGIEKSFCQSSDFAKMMVGNVLATGSKPFAMCYGGHQFGNWANQLGDGRAINLGEIQTPIGHMNLQLKGAGPTQYSRTADGFAVLRSSVREFLCSEAMFYLGVPTTRALSLTLTGEDVMRDMMYNGNAAYEKGAVVCRVAPTCIRFGNFELLSVRKDYENLKHLLDFTIKEYFPEISSQKDKYILFFESVSASTCKMIVEWQRVGFVHGVMNTDNMSILGQTIDYGPYGWLDDYDPNWTPNTTDLPGKRYRFSNQPLIAQWNIMQLANALYEIIPDETTLNQIIQDFKLQYETEYLGMMCKKLGLSLNIDGDGNLIFDLEKMLQLTETDFTIFFRELSKIEVSMSLPQILNIMKPSYYAENLSEETLREIYTWFISYQNRLKMENQNSIARKTIMNQVNPKYILRNYMSQLAIEEANQGKYDLIHELHEMLKKPYDDQPKYEKWYAKRPNWAKEKVGCSMLSCSS